MRRLRAMEIVARGGQVKRLADSRYMVRSQHRDAWYKVECKDGNWSCECPDQLERRKECKHIFAVLFILKLPQIVSDNAIQLPARLPGIANAIESRVQQEASHDVSEWPR
jgi:hypothetical protein